MDQAAEALTFGISMRPMELLYLVIRERVRR